MKTRMVWAVMGLLALVLFGTIYAWPRTDHPAAMTSEPETAAALDTTGIDGAALYGQLCDQCHGLTVTTYGPALTTPSNVSDSALTMLILKGVPGTSMPALSESVTPEQLAALVGYLKAEVLPKSPEDKQRLEIGPNAVETQMGLELVQVPDGNLIARAFLKDAQGAPVLKAKVDFSRVSSFGGRVLLQTVETNEQGLTIYYYPIQPGESVRLEAAYAGERGRQASAAVEEASLAGGETLPPLASGLTAATPPVGLAVILALVFGGVWLTFGRIVSLLWEIAAAKTAPRGFGR